MGSYVTCMDSLVEKRVGVCTAFAISKLSLAYVVVPPGGMLCHVVKMLINELCFCSFVWLFFFSSLFCFR